MGSEDQFESKYTLKFQLLANPYGVFIEYKKDRAAIDLGIHLMSHDVATDTRIWFQLKGKHKSTLSLEVFANADYVSYDFEIDHLRKWYRSPEPVYVVVYIESADLFLAEDVRDIVNRQWGDEILNPAMFNKDQKKARVRISKNAEVNEDFWKRLYSHRSMRIDGRSFRGRPLGHSHDPLTTTLSIMEPSFFSELIDDLLSEYGYKVKV